MAAVSVFPASAQNITPEGMARTVSLSFFVGELCPKFIKVDVDMVRQFSLASSKVGNGAVGVKKFGDMMKVEIKRRAKEIDATGPAMWCSYQKANLNAQGLRAFPD